MTGESVNIAYPQRKTPGASTHHRLEGQLVTIKAPWLVAVWTTDEAKRLVLEPLVICDTEPEAEAAQRRMMDG